MEMKKTPTSKVYAYDYQGDEGKILQEPLDRSDVSKNTDTYTPTPAPTLSPTPTAPTYDTSTLDTSDKGSAALGAYEAAKNAIANYGDFSFSEQDWLNGIKDDIQNYGDFSYDVNSDALYQQYADQYIRQGKLAMQDAMGQAAAMTGGYGNSWAATVGNQAYQAYLQQLNDKVPELYQLALDRYTTGKEDLYNQYGMLLNEYDREHGLYTDEYNKLIDALGIAKDDYYNGADMFYAEQNNYSSTGGDTSGVSTSGVTSDIKNKAASFTSNTDLADYLDGLVASNTITEEESDTLYAEYVDNNEKYDANTGAISYKDMIGSSNGWEVVDKGGANLWGIDKDAILKAPNGETIRLDQLRDKLKEEGMTHSEATDAIKKLQQNLGISSNWMFGW